MRLTPTLRFVGFFMCLVCLASMTPNNVTGGASSDGRSKPLSPRVGRFVLSKPTFEPNRLRRTEFLYSVEGSATWSPPEPTVVVSGPSVESGSGTTIGCQFSLWDPDGYLWDFTWEARLKDPSGQQIAAGTDWVSQKTGINGAIYGEGTSEGDYSCDVDWYVYFDYLGPAHISFPSCADVRDNIIEEYRAGQVAWTPACGDFSTSGSTTHFQWSEVNQSPGSGHQPYGIIKQILWTGLEDTRTEYNRGGITIESGYRCPHGNAQVGGKYQSRHMWGDAADMTSSSHPWNQTEWDLLADAADDAGATYIEPYNQAPDHVHADWR